jgi:ATP-dependent phosphofructokinase / diphosphate-dependent phosphofructokinase
MAKRTRRARAVGLLTGGGDCPGLNAVIRAVAKSLLFEHGFRVIGIEDGFQGMIEGRGRELRSNDVSGILQVGGTILGTSNAADPFRYAVAGRGGAVECRDVSVQAIRHCRRTFGIDALVAVGGDGTMKIAHRLAKMGLPVVGVPKTIDNDLAETDSTFGFDSAVTVISEAVDRLHTTAQSHHRVMLVETMGRYAGWLALTGGVAGGGDILLIPEIPYRIENVCEACLARSRRGKRFSIVVVAEGAKAVDGDLVVQEKDPTRTDPLRLGGIANVIARQISERAGLETRVTVLGHLQRGGSPTPFDRVLATRFGVEAARLVGAGDYGKMACLKGVDIAAIPIARAISRLKTVPPDGNLVRTARSVGTSFGD